MIAAEVALVLVVLGIAIGVHVGLLLGSRGKAKAVKLATDEAAAVNRLLNQYAPDTGPR